LSGDTVVAAVNGHARDHANEVLVTARVVVVVVSLQIPIRKKQRKKSPLHTCRRSECSKYKARRLFFCFVGDVGVYYKAEKAQ
jgi:hypothetical protein